MTAMIEIILLLGIIGLLIIQNKPDWTDLFSKRRKIILDSCALIDGRIIEIVKTRFVTDELIIPQFILNELQLLADGNDSHKRERARFGLDVAHELQDTAFHAKVTVDRTELPAVNATDDKLIQLAKKMEAFLYTTDYNLSKVASIEGVAVLNVNELAQGLRPIALPGETLQIKIIQKGSNPSQGVGYLEDGTMIVVEGGARHAGKNAVDVTVTRMHQTVAGKMVFGHVREKAGNSSHSSKSADPSKAAHLARHGSGHSVSSHHQASHNPAAKLVAKMTASQSQRSTLRHSAPTKDSALRRLSHKPTSKIM